MAMTTTRAMDESFSDVLKDSMIDQPRYDLGFLLDYIQCNIEPENIYDKGELDDWAVANGYAKAVF